MNVKRMLRTTCWVAAIGVGVPASSAGATLVLTQDPDYVYSQSDGRPCVIGDPSCKQSGWDVYVIQNSDVVDGEYAVYSPYYTVEQLRDLNKGEFLNIGIDINSAAPPIEALLEFSIFINDVLMYSFFGTLPLQQLNNGTGYSDALLQGFNLTGLLDTDTVRFFAHVSNASDGREQFFLVGGSEIPDRCVTNPEECVPPPPPTCEETNTCPPDPNVPEPASLLLFGTALAAGVIRRRRSGRN